MVRKANRDLLDLRDLKESVGLAQMNSKLVSCVMPTWNRRAFIPCAIDCFLRQTYEPRELVILDDGEEPIEDLIPKDMRIRYIFENRRRITGDKRNRVVELAKGEVICHWDDDDWSAPDRIADQMARLQKTGKNVTGYGTLLFWDMREKRAKRFRSAVKEYVCGTTLCYLKSFWSIHRFRAEQKSSDNDFVYPIPRHIAPCGDYKRMVARIHNCHHTSPKTGVHEVVAKDLIPAGFWENEKLRLA